ncbi:hypothetical protein L195_g019832, partial [Trifolium pratense]
MSRALSMNKASPWWNDLMKVGVVPGSDRLQGIFFKKIGNGGGTSFCHDAWVGAQPLKEAFPRLFLISSQKDCCASEVGHWEMGAWVWDLRWRRNLFVWEEELRDLLVDVLTPIQLSNSLDEWRCHYSNGGIFTVSSLYRHLSDSIIPPFSFDQELVRDLGYLWKSLAPSKVIVFSWQLLLRRLPTRVNLAKRGIVGNDVDSFCVLCPLNLECEEHLFGGCAFAESLWSKVFTWFGWVGAVPRDPLKIFQKFSVGRGNGKRLKGLLAVWHVVVWAIWRTRNDVIFNSKVPVMDEELLAIQQQGPRAIGFFGTRNMGFMHQELIEILSYAMVITKNHIYTSGASGTNAAVIRGALRAEKPELLTVILPQSLSKQPPESQELLSKEALFYRVLVFCHSDCAPLNM